MGAFENSTVGLGLVSEALKNWGLERAGFTEYRHDPDCSSQGEKTFMTLIEHSWH